MRNFFIATVLLFIPWGVFAQLIGLGAQDAFLTQYTNGETNDSIFVFCQASGNDSTGVLQANVAGPVGVYNFQWYKYDLSIYNYSPWYSDTMVASSTASNLKSGGYRVTVTDTLGNAVACYRAWIFVSNIVPVIDSIDFSCQQISLNANYSAIPPTFDYYDPPSEPFIFDTATTEVEICFTADHTFVSDLGFVLFGPASCGSPGVTIHADGLSLTGTNCNDADDVVDLCFSSDNLTPLDICLLPTNMPLTGNFAIDAFAPFGSGYPAGNLSVFNGCDAASGGWQAMIFDCAGLDVGVMQDITLTFTSTISSASSCDTGSVIVYQGSNINSPINDNSCSQATASVFTVPFQVQNPVSFNYQDSLDDYIANNPTAVQWSSNQAPLVFTDPNALSTTLSPPPGSTTSFYLSVTSPYGCVFTDTMVYQHTHPNADSLIFSNITCNGLNNGQAVVYDSWAEEYSIDGGLWQASNTFNNLSPGAHTIYLKTSNGICGDTLMVAIAEPSKIQFFVNSFDATCYNKCDANIIVGNIGGTPPYSYLWNTGETISFMVGICPGNYVVDVFDANGCNLDSAISVVSPSPYSFVLNIDSTDCFADNGAIAIENLSGASPSYTFNWDVLSGGGTDSFALNLARGIYALTISDSLNCDTVLQMEVLGPELPQINLSSDSAICVGGTATIYAQVNGGILPYTYTWNNGWAGPGPHLDMPGVNTCYALSITDNIGCQAVPRISCISIYDSIDVQVIIDQMVCPGDYVGFSAVASGGHPDSTMVYQWSHGVGNGSFVNFNAPDAFPDTTDVWVYANDGCSNTDSALAQITYFELPKMNFTISETLGCEPFKVTFYNLSDPSQSCLWDLGDGTFINGCDSVVHTYTDSGLYSPKLILTSLDGCLLDTTFPNAVRVDPKPFPNFTYNPDPPSVYKPEVEFLDASSGVNIAYWFWEFLDADGLNVAGKDSVIAPVFDYSVLFDGNDSYAPYWGDQTDYPVHFTIGTLSNCWVDTIIFVEFDKRHVLAVPSAFTPNGDGLNDLFFPQGIGINPEDEFVFSIFDRWGELIFESDRLDEAWDGRASKKGGSKVIRDGVYIWKLEYRDVKRKPISEYGKVLLLKSGKP